MSVVKISVRDLVKYAYRHGGLLTGTVFSETDDTPNSIHSQVIGSLMKKKPELLHFPEYSLKYTHSSPPISLEIRGRADLITETENGLLIVTEIKTIIDDQGRLPSEADILHTAQAKIYAFMYCLEKSEVVFDKILINVRYILAPSYSTREFTESVSLAELEMFFSNTVSQLYDFTRSLHDYRLLRDTTIKAMKFPYDDLRQGQKDLMNTVLEVVRNKEPLYAQAPTGIGKTISVLYPSVKAIPTGIFDYIFYLTAKTSTQAVACDALDDMRKAGAMIKSIRITAKEKLCLCKDIYCDMEKCEYAVNYYSQSRNALKELFIHDSIDASVLLEIANKYRVCPFEIGLDISMFCDIIVCDYNYVFDPRIKLARFFNEDSFRNVFLIDEAHNLPSRSNEMYSASLSSSLLNKMSLHEHLFTDGLRKIIKALSDYFLRVSEFIKTDLSTFDKKIDKSNIVKVDNICASRKKPQELIDLCGKFVSEARPVLDRIDRHEVKKPLLDLFFEIRFFDKAGSEFYNDDYITLISTENDNVLIRLKCLNSSDKLAEYYNGRNTTVYFSATMSPQEYFIPLLSGRKSNFNIKRKVLPSPFPPENLWIGIASGISTKYDRRPFTLDAIASMIFASVSYRKGNYLVYCPSFDYQRMIMTAFKEYTEKEASTEGKRFKIVGQKRGMSESERNGFLDLFFAERSNTLIGFAVLGGVFGEGIDLTGESLSGVILVGVGLPGKSFEQDILMDYFDKNFGNGFDHAYKYPGFNKILQAAGRVIRTETDKGFILLIDERYGREDYMALFPEEWDPVIIGTADDITSGLSEFFRE